MGNFEVQVFVGLIVVLAAAMVALNCDYLKGSNERLRERNAELCARQQEMEQLIDRLQTQHAALRSAATPARPVRPLAPAVAAVAESVLSRLEAAPATSLARPLPAMEAAPVPAALMPAPVDAGRPARPTVRTFGFDLALARDVVARYHGQALDLLGREEIAAPALVAPVAEQPALAPLAAAPVAAEPSATLDNVVVLPAPAPASLAASSISEVQVPGGHFDAAALDDLVARHGIFCGLVVVVSVIMHGELAEDHRGHYNRLMNSITRTVRSLGRDQDFTARSAEDEFVLIFPREVGKLAQRRIQQISERLWDFQLRSLGACAVMFAWGAEESTDETLARLLESARAQIQASRAAVQQQAAPQAGAAAAL
jgi:hypothetical protein